MGRAKKGRWSTRAALAEMARLEEIERSRRSLERRLGNARIGRFKPLVDFDWDWPKKIDRPLIERALTLDFVPEGRNLILLGANGLGKTMITAFWPNVWKLENAVASAAIPTTPSRSFWPPAQTNAGPGTSPS